MSRTNQLATTHSIIKYWSLLIFFVTSLFSVLFYKERVIYVDSALQMFEMINNNTFAIYVERYSMYINQLIPLLLIKSSAPLSNILMSYSIMGVLISMCSFWICYSILKNKEAAIVIATFIIMYRHAYFHAISETHYAISYSALFYAYITFYITKSKQSKIWFYLITTFLLLLNYFIHPITFFLLLFSVCFIAINNKAYRKTELYLTLACTILIFITKFLFSTNGHENSFFNELKSSDVFTFLFDSHSFEYFISSLDGLYLIPLLLFMLTIALYIIDKEYLSAICIVGFVVFFILINAITFHRGESELVLETRFAPLYFFMAIPLFNKLLQKSHWHFIVVIAILTIQLLVTFVEIESLANSTFKKRMSTLMIPLINNKESKIIIEKRNVESIVELTTWCSSVETLLYSSLEGKSFSKTLYIPPIEQNIDNPSYSDRGLFLFVPWWIYYSTNDLNKEYFGISEEPYVKINRLN